jgi:hypothetical protein
MRAKEELPYPVPFICVATVGYPIMGREIDSFSDVWTHGKPTMKSPWKSHYIFSWLLKQLIYWYF